MAYNQIGQIGQRVGPEGSSIRSGWVRDASGAWLFVGHATVPKDSFIAFEGRYLYGGTLYFTSSGTFSKADYPGLRAVMVEVQAGGGGGGGVSVANAGQAAAASGGGGGGYSEKRILADDLLDSETVTVGEGGDGGGGEANGTDGGDSSFGSHCSGSGGGGGGGRSGGSGWGWVYEGAGGQGSGGDLNIVGEAGGRGIIAATGPTGNVVRTVQLGWGGGSHLGGQSNDWANSTTGSSGPAGRPRGGGGAGAYRNNTAGSQNGGSGADGIVVVRLYY